MSTANYQIIHTAPTVSITHKWVTLSKIFYKEQIGSEFITMRSSRGPHLRTQRNIPWLWERRPRFLRGPGHRLPTGSLRFWPRRLVILLLTQRFPRSGKYTAQWGRCWRNPDCRTIYGKSQWEPETGSRKTTQTLATSSETRHSPGPGMWYQWQPKRRELSMI